MGRFLTGGLRRNSVQGRLFEGLSDLIDASQDIGAVAGPFIGPVRQMTDRISNILNTAFLSALFQQSRKLLERRSTGSLSHPASKHGTSAKANQDCHHDKDASAPVSHPPDIARFSDHPAQKHPGGEEDKEYWEKVHHGVKLT